MRVFLSLLLLEAFINVVFEGQINLHINKFSCNNGMVLYKV